MGVSASVVILTTAVATTLAAPQVSGNSSSERLVLAGNVYVPGRAGTHIQVIAADPEQWRCRKLFSLSGERILTRLSLDGRRIAAEPGANTGRRPTIEAFDVASGRRLFSVRASTLSPRWGRIAFQEGQSLVVSGTEGGKRRVVATTKRRNVAYSNIDWSLDERWLAYTVSVSGERGELETSVHVVRADGRLQRRLYREEARLSASPYARWSPNGRTLAVTGGSGPSIFRIDRDGRAKRMLAAKGSWPIWSPDGGQLAFRTSDYNVDQISVVGVDGSARRQLTFTKPPPIGEEQRGSNALAWSPDGARIAFLRHFDLAVMRADGSGQRVICGLPRGIGVAAWTRVARG